VSEMIERVAKAIYEADGAKGWHLHSAFYLKAARMAIEAMRDPTDGMIGAATRIDFDNEDEAAMATNLWHAMLAESLK